MFAKVAFPVPYHDFFTYRIPVELRSYLHAGILVLAPFGNRMNIGTVINLSGETDIAGDQIREITAIGDPALALSENMLRLAKEVSSRYGSSIGMVIKAMLPPGTFQHGKIYYCVGPGFKNHNKNKKVAGLFRDVEVNPGGISQTDIKKYKNLTSRDVDKFVKEGVLSISSMSLSKTLMKRGKERWIKSKVDKFPDSLKEKTKAGVLLKLLVEKKKELSVSELVKMGFSSSSISTLRKKDMIEEIFKDKKITLPPGFDSLVDNKIVELTLWQKSALEKIAGAIDEKTDRKFLLYGITSSGKTQVYLESVKYVLGMGKSALILVPEISLTPQIVARFERFLDEKAMVLHSGLNPTERLITYRKISSEETRLVIGTRSAVFSPLKNLGIIVIDEEQDQSYKQDDPSPRYHTRDVAFTRSKISNCPVILGSATPSAESYFKSKAGDIEFLELPQRVTGYSLPEINLISTQFKPEQKDKEPVFPPGFWPISGKLYSELSIRLKNKEQVIILLNRRGYSSSVICFECGWVGKCPDCEVGWTYHKARNMMICHFCGLEKKGLSLCPNCDSPKLSFRGAGTQKLEEKLKELFPHNPIKRLDTDAITKKFESQDILNKFGGGKYSILLGTQMVAKGHHFPDVTFVAVIGADIGMSLPDFRASERAMQSLIQASGRAGRSSKKISKSIVMIQSFDPDNPVFSYLMSNNYLGFLNEDLMIRETLQYPPYTRLISLTFSSTKPESALKGSSSLAARLKQEVKEDELILLGPAKSAMFRRGKYYRYQILIKTPSTYNHDSIIKIVNDFGTNWRAGSIRLDVDPYSFM